MIKPIIKVSLLALLAIAVAGMPLQVRAQETNKPAAKKAVRPASAPFHGKLKAIDQAAKTISVGEMIIQITSETKIMKDGKPATLEDGVVGEEVAGAYKKTEDGKLHATLVRFGAKSAAGGESKKETPKKQQPKKEQM